MNPSFTVDVLETKIALTQLKHVRGFVSPNRRKMLVRCLLALVPVADSIEDGTLTKIMVDVDNLPMEDVLEMRTTLSPKEIVKIHVAPHLPKNSVSSLKQRGPVLDSILAGTMTIWMEGVKSSPILDVRGIEIASLTESVVRKRVIRRKLSHTLMSALFQEIQVLVKEQC